MPFTYIVLPALLLLISNHALAVQTLSDYKICGDPECESLVSRVHAIEYHKGSDCRFLNFRKGDVIFVYYKLSGKRDDLWAGTIDKKFGYFPKEAVNVEYIYAQEEVRLPTQEHDFFCIDEYGSIIESDLSQWESEENEVYGNTEQHETKSESTEEPSHIILNNKGEDSPIVGHVLPNNAKQKSTEQGGSYWIGSQVTGWLGLGSQSDDSSLEQPGEQDSFKSRKLALDMDGNELEKVPTTEAPGWLEGGLANIFGFSQRQPEANVEETNERDKSTNRNTDQTSVGLQHVEEAVIKPQDESLHSSSWLNIGISDILSFVQRNSEVPGGNRHPEASLDEKMDIDGENQPSVPSTMSQAGVYQDENSGKAKEETSKREDVDIHPVSFHVDSINVEVNNYNSVPEGKITIGSDIKNNERTSWYSSVYNGIAGFHNEQPEVQNGGDINSPEHSEGPVTLKPVSKKEEDGIQDESGKYLKPEFSTDGTSMFDSVASRYQPNIPDVNNAVQNNKESASEITNEGKEVLLKSQTNTIDESKEENVDYHSNSIDQHSIQPGVETTENNYEIKPMSEQMSSEDKPLDNYSPDLQQNSEDYSLESDFLNKGIEIAFKDPGNNDIESTTQIELSDISVQLQDNTEHINSLSIETELIQLVEKPNADDKKVEKILQISEKNNVHIFEIPLNVTDPAENFTDQVVILYSDGAVAIESTEIPNLTASTQSFTEDKIPNLELSTIDYSGATSKVDIETEDEESLAHQNKDHIKKDIQSLTTDHPRDGTSLFNIGQMDSLSSTDASVHKQVEKPDFIQIDVQDPCTDESILTEGGIDENEYKNLNMIIYKNEEEDISKEETEMIKADITVFKEAPQEQKHGTTSIHSEVRKTNSNTGKEKEEFTSTGYNLEEDSEVIVDLELISKNEQVTQTNQESMLDSIKVDPSTQSSSDETDGKIYESKLKNGFELTEAADIEYQFNKTEETAHRSKTLINEELNITEGEMVKGGLGVPPVQDLKEVENSSINILRPKDDSDITQSEPKDLSGTTADGMYKQNRQKRDIHLREIQLDGDIKYVDSEQTDSQRVQEDCEHHTGQDESMSFVNEDIALTDHQSLPGSQSQTETCINAVDEGNVCQTSAEQEKTEVLRATLDIDQAEDFSNKEGAVILPETKVGKDNLKGKTFDPFGEVNSETNSEEGEMLLKINGSVVQEPSDQNEDIVGYNEQRFISDKQEGLSSISQSKSYKTPSSTTEKKNVLYLVEDLNQDQVETMTKHMGNTDLLKDNIDTLPMKHARDYTKEIFKPKECGDEILFDSPGRVTEIESHAIHSTKEDLKATQVFREYKNMQVHLSGEDILYFLDLFGKHKLLWLDYCLGNTEIENEVQNNDLAILSDFERILQYRSGIIHTSTESTQGDRNVKEKDIHNKNMSLKKLEILLSTVRSRYTTEKPTVTVNVNQGGVFL